MNALNEKQKLEVNDLRHQAKAGEEHLRGLQWYFTQIFVISKL